MAQEVPTPQPAVRRDPAWAGLLLFALAALYLLPFWSRVGLDSDEAKIIYGALRMQGGERLYLDFFEFIPPGIYSLVSVVLAVAGRSIFALRLVMVLFGAAIVAGTWAVAKRATGRPVGALFPAAAALVFGLSHWCIVSIHWVSTAFALFATLALLDVDTDDRAPWRAWLLAGLGTGGALAVAQHKGVALAVAAVLLAGVSILAGRQTGRRRGALGFGPEDAFAAGLVIILGPICLALAARGELVPMLQAAFGWTREGYSVANRVPYGYGAAVALGPTYWPPIPILGPALSGLARLVVLYLAPASLFALLGRGAARALLPRGPAAWPDLTVALTGLAMWGTAWSRPDVLHLLTVAPWGFVALMLLVSPARRIAPPVLSAWTGFAMRAAAGVAVVLVLFGAVGDQLERRHWARLDLGGLGFVRYDPQRAPNYSMATSDYGRTIRFIQAATGPNEEIFVYPYAPFFYYLTGRANATRYNICFPGYQGAAAIDEVIDTLERRRVPFVILDPSSMPELQRRMFPGYDPAVFQNSPLTQFVRSRYELVQQYGYVRVMRRRNL